MNLAGAVSGGNNITEVLRNGQRESLSFKQHRRNGDASDGDDDGDGSADDLTTASASVPLRNRRGSMREILAASVLRKELWVAMDLPCGIS